MDSESESEAPKRRSSRNRGESNERKTRRNRRQAEPEVRRAGLRNGNRRVRADSSIQIQESENDYSEAVSYNKNHQKEYDEQFEKLITAGPVQVDKNHVRDDVYSQRGSKNKKGAIIAKEGRMTALKADKLEEIY